MAKKQPKQWVYSPPKPTVPRAVKDEVAANARAFIDAELKPKHLKPPPDARFNYLVGVFACPGPDALSPTFDSKLARLLYVGPGRFNLAFQRHMGQWVELYEGLPLQKCLEAIRDDPWFIPV